MILHSPSKHLNLLKRLFTYIFLLFIFSCGNSQQTSDKNYKLIGNCEGCEAVFEYGDMTLNSVDTLPDFSDKGEKIKITGTIFRSDGKTPAEGVILYVYHTNQEGIYQPGENAEGWGKRHGYIRGWMKTGADGKYSFYTLKPGTYPDRSLPAHIHATILEPDGRYYWLGSYHFEGDPLLTKKEINPPSPRGGSTGLIKLKNQNDIKTGNRDIILGKNVPGY